MLQFSEKLYSLLSAPYCFIQLRTWEEQRIVKIVAALAQAMGRSLKTFTPGQSPAAELLDLLREVAGGDERSITVVVDCHPYLADTRVTRCLRELEPDFTKQGQVLVFVSPFVDLPRELSKDFTFLDAPLPGRVELRVVLDEVFPPGEELAVDRERLVAAALGLTMREARRAFFRASFEWEQASRKGSQTFRLDTAVAAEKRQLIEVDRVLEFCDLAQELDQVGGLASLKSWLGERRAAFSPEAAEFGLPSPKGMLLTGVQGCGKSLVSKVVASFWGIPLLRLDIGRLFDGARAPDEALQRGIQTAEALAPAVLWIDEIDKGFVDVTSGTAARLMGSLLNWLQDKLPPVFVVATANRVAHLPPELLRKGRFDEIFFVDLPNEAEREEILRIHLTRHGRSPEPFDLAVLCQQTNHFSGAELEQLIVSGLYKAFAAGRELSQNDLLYAIQETVPLYRTYEEEIKALRQWAESRARPASHDPSLLNLFK